MNAFMRAAAFAVVLMFPLSAYSQTVDIRLGTIAAEGTPWHDVLNRMKQDWNRASNGKVVVRIFSGGIIGGENEMVDAVRIGQIQAVGVSGVALSRIVPGVGALQLPMLVDNYDDLDRVRNALEPRLEEAMAKEGFIVLNFSEVGWVQFFTKEKAKTPADLKKLKLFINADDSDVGEALSGPGLPSGPSRGHGSSDLIDHGIDRCFRCAAASRARQSVLRSREAHDRSQVGASDRCDDNRPQSLGED